MRNGVGTLRTPGHLHVRYRNVPCPTVRTLCPNPFHLHLSPRRCFYSNKVSISCLRNRESRSVPHRPSLHPSPHNFLHLSTITFSMAWAAWNPSAQAAAVIDVIRVTAETYFEQGHGQRVERAARDTGPARPRCPNIVRTISLVLLHSSLPSS